MGCLLYLFFAICNSSQVFQKAGKNDEYSSIADVDAIFLAAGEDEPVRKGTAFQVRLYFSYSYSTDLVRVASHRHGFLDTSFPPHSSCSRKTSYLFFALRQRVLHLAHKCLRTF